MLDVVPLVAVPYVFRLTLAAVALTAFIALLLTAVYLARSKQGAQMLAAGGAIAAGIVALCSLLGSLGRP